MHGRHRPTRHLLTTALACTLCVSLLACSGDAEDAGGADPAPTTSAAPDPTTASTEEPDVHRLLIERLTRELDDATTAEAVVAGLSPETRSALTTAVPPDEIATSPKLSYRPTTTEGPVGHLVVLAFGNRVGADGSITPGPTNEALADAVEAYVADHPTPVYAQWEVAELLIERGVPDVVSIEPVVGPDGSPTYLSTSGVTDQVVAHAARGGIDLGTVGIVGFADHVVRCVATAAASGIERPVVVEGLMLPSEYDPESGQEWTRDRVGYVSVDLAGRIAAG